MKERVETEIYIVRNLLNNPNIKVNGKMQNNAPFINMIPTEIKLAILLLLDDKSCTSLFRVSIDWMNFFIPVADLYLNSISEKVEDVASIKTRKFILDIDQFETTYSKEGKSSPHLQTLIALKTEIEKLRSPLAQFLHCQKRVNGIMQAIAASYSHCPPNRSMMYSFLERCTFIPKSSPSEENWFKIALFCSIISEKNATGRLIVEAAIELKELEVSCHKPEVEASPKNPSFPVFFKTFSIQTQSADVSEKILDDDSAPAP